MDDRCGKRPRRHCRLCLGPFRLGAHFGRQNPRIHARAQRRRHRLRAKGQRLAIARYNGATLIWTGTAAKPLELEWKGAHIGVTFSPDGRFLVTTMQENALHGWRLEDNKHMRMTGYPAKVKDWSWSARAKWLATSGAPAAIVWPFAGKDGPMGKAPLELGLRGDSMVTAVACHPVEDIAAIGYNDGMILIVRFADSKEVLLRRPGKGQSPAWDGTPKATVSLSVRKPGIVEWFL